MKYAGSVTGTWAFDAARYGLTFADGRLTELAALPVDDGLGEHEEPIVLLPGLVDLQVNGWDGVDFNQEDLRPDDLFHVARGMAAGGVTGFLPTIVTASRARILHAMAGTRRAIEAFEAQERPPGARPLGIHLEGPYLSGEAGFRGAHPAEHCRDPDWEEFVEFQEASGDRIGLLTAAPERAGAIGFIRRVVESGVVVSVGHTAADRETLSAAVDAGATLSTHLGNGCSATLPRHPNLLWEQLADDRLSACLIADGHHLPDATLKVMLRTKGRARSLFVSDVQGLGGKPAGVYETPHLGRVELLPEGRAVVAGQRVFLAGAVARMHDSWPVFARATGGTLTDWAHLTSVMPSQVLGRSVETAGPTTVGDLALFANRAGRLTPRLTVVGGQVVFVSSDRDAA